MSRLSQQMIGVYLDVKQRVIDAGFAAEIDWQETQRIEQVTESELLREVAWVILSSGMKERVIRTAFVPLSQAFLNWTSARVIWMRRKDCAQRAIEAFGHVGKINAILAFAEYVHREGFTATIAEIERDGPGFLQGFPYLGPATSLHLAKNLGLDVVKPDRHLCRIAQASSAESPAELCQWIADAVGDRMNVVDLVLWRFATLCRDYVELFSGVTGTEASAVGAESPTVVPELAANPPHIAVHPVDLAI